MTREEILALPAGREMDSLVAEKVMELVWDETRCRVCGWPLKASAAAGCVADNCSLRPRPLRKADEPAPYSTDIAAAWTVVEWLRCVRTNVILVMHPWAISAYNLNLKGEAYDYVSASSGDGAPLAICRAALLATTRDGGGE